MIKVAIGTCLALAALITIATRSSSEGTASVEVREPAQASPTHAAPVAIQPQARTPLVAARKPMTKPVVEQPIVDANDIGDPEVFRAQQLELLKTEVEHETRDDAWAARASEQIRDRFKLHESIANLEIDCRESLCRLDLTFAADHPSSPDIGAITRSIPWPANGTFDVAADGSSALIYVTREGRTLPMI